MLQSSMQLFTLLALCWNIVGTSLGDLREVGQSQKTTRAKKLAHSLLGDSLF